MATWRRWAPAVATIAIAACSGSLAPSTVGRGVVLAESSTIVVGDSVQLTPGVRYSDGRFVAIETATVTSAAPGIASYNSMTRYLRGVAAGTARITVTVPEVATFDTTFTVVAAP